jgi:hypothetical protein
MSFKVLLPVGFTKWQEGVEAKEVQKMGAALVHPPPLDCGVTMHPGELAL